MSSPDSNLTVNPHLLVILERDDGMVSALTVRAPVNGQHMRVTKISRSIEPQVFTALLIHSQTGTWNNANFTAEEESRLAEIGVLLPPEMIASRVWFSCDVENLPFDWVPTRVQPETPSSASIPDLVVNPTLQHLGKAGPTAEMRGHLKLSNAFHPDRSWIALADPSTGMTCLFSYSEQSANAIESLRAGEPLPERIAEDLRESLFAAGIIESANAIREARDRCQRARAAARQTLEQQRYVVLPKILPPLQLAAIRRYYRELISAGFLPFGDEEWPNRFFAARDPVARFYHEQFRAIIDDIAGERTKASFCFFASYHPGSILPAHRDREQCEWALSLLIDQSPESDLSPWPLYMQPPQSAEATPIYSGVGDGILYYGREVRHHRDELTSADYCSFWFMFYVPEDFAGSLD